MHETAPDLGIPEVKPAIESVRGIWHQKLSPRTRHALLQGRMWSLLTQWAGERGDVGTEWRFYIVPASGPPSSLVPDVAYVAIGRLSDAEGDLRERPVLAPDIAVEILSPDDRARLLEEKVAMYRANGTALVIIVDPSARTVRLRDARADTIAGLGDIGRSVAFPDLAIDTTALFDRII